MWSYHHINHSNKWYSVPVTSSCHCHCHCCCHCHCPLLRHINHTLFLGFVNQHMHSLAMTPILMIQQGLREADRWRQKILFQRKVPNKCTAHHCTAHSISSHRIFKIPTFYLTSRNTPWLPDVHGFSLCIRGIADHRPEIMTSSVHFKKWRFQTSCQDASCNLSKTWAQL